METARMVQAVILMLIMAMAASCASSKEYTSKLFHQNKEGLTHPQAVTITFLDLDATANRDDASWVTTDIITGKDSTNQTLALDSLARIKPAIAQIKIDSMKKITPVESEPVAKSTRNADGTRSKRTRD